MARIATEAYAKGYLLPSGRYIQAVPSVNDNMPITQSREYLFGLLLAPQTIERVAISVLTAAASSVVRLGIRSDNDGTPSAVVAEGTVDSTTTGWKELVVNYAHPGGALWASITGQGAATLNIDGRSHVQGGQIIPLASAASRATIDWASGHTAFMAYQDGVTGALPATFVNAATTSQRLPVLVLKRA